MSIHSTFRPGFLEGKAGLRCIGDVHGDPQFRDFVAEARSKNYAILSMGDIVDRGPDTPGAIRTLIDLIDTGDGDLVAGNHDWRYFRYLRGSKVHVSKSMVSTLSQMDEARDGDRLRERYLEIIGDAALWHEHGAYLFAHGGISTAMPGAPPLRMGEEGAHKASSFNRALYGETDGRKNAEGYPIRVYGWVDNLPADRIAIIGHDSRPEIAIITGAMGGKAILIDTGAGKGGRLSYYDIAIDGLT